MKVKSIFPYFVNFISQFETIREHKTKPHTAYQPIFRHFAEFDIKRISRMHIHKYIEKRLIEGKSPSTINNEIKAFKRFYRFLYERQLISFNKYLEIKEIKNLKEKKRKDIKILSKYELETLYNEILKLDLKHKLICLLALQYGLRPKEIKTLKWEDIFLVDKKFKVKRAKNGIYQIFPMTEEVYRAFLFLKKQTGKFTYVFASRISKTGHLTEFRRWWRNFLKRIGFKYIRFYDLRHNFAIHKLMEVFERYQVHFEEDAYDIMQALGHTDLRSTQHYINIVKTLKYNYSMEERLDRLTERIDDVNNIISYDHRIKSKIPCPAD